MPVSSRPAARMGRDGTGRKGLATAAGARVRRLAGGTTLTAGRGLRRRTAQAVGERRSSRRAGRPAGSPVIGLAFGTRLACQRHRTHAGRIGRRLRDQPGVVADADIDHAARRWAGRACPSGNCRTGSDRRPRPDCPAPPCRAPSAGDRSTPRRLRRRAGSRRFWRCCR